jgi:hypothetical protein
MSGTLSAFRRHVNAHDCIISLSDASQLLMAG